MGRPVFFVENLFSEVQFPAHAVTASTEDVSAEAWRVATGRRNRRDRWMPTTTNAEAWVKVDCGQARTADMLALDRGHNLAGHQVQLQRSSDGVAWTTVFTATIPSAVTSQGDVDEDDGVTTEEGAWLKRFSSLSYRHWRLRVPAMGAGLRPEVVGAWLGRGWTPQEYFDLPYSDAGLQLGGAEHESDVGWLGVSPLRHARRGEIGLKLRGEGEYEDHARYHIERNFWRRRPMWIVFDDERAERAVLAVPRTGEYGLDRAEGWGARQASLAWVEHEPRLP